MFQFKQFSISQEHSALKLGTDAVLLGAIATFDTPTNILDIGTGTGILALMMAQKYSCPITAIDIDSESLHDAQQNIMSCDWSNRIFLENIDVQSFSRRSIQFDGIICNPPFFSNSLQCSSTAKTNARHTTTLTPKELFVSIQRILFDTGTAYVIIPYSEKSLFVTEALLQNIYCIAETNIFPFEMSPSPNRVVLRFSKMWKSVEINQIAIRKEDRDYTDEYRMLTKEFYL